MRRSRPKDLLQRFAERRQGASRQLRPAIAVADAKARQSAKIKQLGEALVAAGYRRLDQQAKTLGLPRSTTWTILKANHKNSGLSAAIINRMLSAPELPAPVRLKIVEYIEEKSAGLYGDGEARARKFSDRLATRPTDRTQAS
jgi:predicted DNA-binding transcriptional regulator AlpA